jgi:tRNA nucleotidyltransferase/poly(A) polymerase
MDAKAGTPIRPIYIVDYEGRQVLVGHEIPAVHLPGFHGTDVKFSRFRSDKPNYFTPNLQYGYVTKNPIVHEVELRFSHPLLSDVTTFVEPLRSHPEWVEQLKSQGIDGVVYAKASDFTHGPSGWGDDHPQYVSLDPANIKMLKTETFPADDKNAMTRFAAFLDSVADSDPVLIEAITEAHKTVFALPTEMSEGKSLVKKIRDLGFEAFITGGAVRDIAMGKDSADVDLSTSMPMHMIKKEFPGTYAIGGGEANGTLIVPWNDFEFEVTQFRSEDDELSDGRRPDSVDFGVDASKDSARRDFSINAMRMDHEGKITDEHGGMGDIDSRKIRAVGDPAKRFMGDNLRILRGLRFAAKLGFDIDDKTAEAIEQYGQLLANISPERITSEIVKAAETADAFSRFITLVDKFDLTEIVFGCPVGTVDRQDLVARCDGATFEGLLAAALLTVDDPIAAVKSLRLENSKKNSSLVLKTILAIKELSAGNPDLVRMLEITSLGTIGDILMIMGILGQDRQKSVLEALLGVNGRELSKKANQVAFDSGAQKQEFGKLTRRLLGEYLQAELGE